MLTLEDKVSIVQQWHSSHCIATVRRSFRQRDARYHGKNLPPRSVIWLVIDNFQQHGTVQDRRKSHIVKRDRVISPRKVMLVNQVYCNKQRVSLHLAAKKHECPGTFLLCEHDSKEGSKEETFQRCENWAINHLSEAQTSHFVQETSQYA